MTFLEPFLRVLQAFLLISPPVLLAERAAAPQEQGADAAAPQAPEPDAEPVPLALVGGTLHTMVKGAEPAAATIVVRGDRIEAVGADVEVPAGASVVDITGFHVIPGLVDGMVNHDADHDLLYVSCGVTLVRDNGNERLRILQERTRAWRDRVPGPDLFIAGLIIDGNPPATTEAVVVTDEIEAAAKLGRLIEDGVDFLSSNVGLPVKAWRKAIAMAHEAGLELWGYLPREAGLQSAVQAGQDGIFSTTGLLPDGKRWDLVEPADLDALVETLARSGIGLTPLVHATGRRLVERADEPPELGLLGPHYRLSWEATLEEWNANLTDDVRGAIERAVAAQEDLVRRLFEAGAELVPGSAAPNQWLLPGDALVRELEHWVHAGIPAVDVLRLATAGAAQAIGVLDERGTLEAGKIADLVVLATDPARDIGVLREPEIVVVRGQLLERDALDERLAELAEEQAQLLAEMEKGIDVEEPTLPEGDKLLSGRAETVAMGRRVSAERFCVVAQPDGHTAYCTRLVVPGSATMGRTAMEFRARYKDHRLEDFEVVVKNGESDFTVKGKRIGGVMNIERRRGALFIDNNRARQPITLVDLGSVLTNLVLAREVADGTFFAVYFEGVDPVEAEWYLEVDSENHVFKLRTGLGLMATAFDARGMPVVSERQTGSATTKLVFSDVKTYGGPGLPLQASRVFVPPPEPEGGDAGPEQDERPDRR